MTFDVILRNAYYEQSYRISRQNNKKFPTIIVWLVHDSYIACSLYVYIWGTFTFAGNSLGLCLPNLSTHLKNDVICANFFSVWSRKWFVRMIWKCDYDMIGANHFIQCVCTAQIFKACLYESNLSVSIRVKSSKSVGKKSIFWSVIMKMILANRIIQCVCTRESNRNLGFPI